MSTTPTVAREAYSIEEFCAAFGLSATTVWRLISSGELKNRRVGARNLIMKADAEDFWASRPTGVARHDWRAGRRPANAQPAAV